MTKQELIQLITDELTVSGSLKIELNEKEISRIIDMEKKYVYRQWRDTVELKMGIIPLSSFRTPEFKESRTIQLPECVWGIHEFRELKDDCKLFGLNDPDLRLERVMGSDLWLSPFSSDVITTRTVSYSWFDLAQSFTLRCIQFNFNPNTHRIQVIGHDPTSSVLVRAFVAIEESDLYDDYLFRKWIIARCKCQMHRLLKTFEYNVIGGVNITSMYGEQGKAEMDEVKEEIKSLNPPDWVIMFQ